MRQLFNMYPFLITIWSLVCYCFGIWIGKRSVKKKIIQLETALTLIGDVAFDRDGFTGDADGLAKLIDEIYGYARNPAEAAKIARGDK